VLSATQTHSLSRRLPHSTVSTDASICRRFSRDQSIYQVVPAAVVTIGTLDDCRSLVRFCSAENLPLTMRGNGSGTAGAALGRGIVATFDRTGPFSTIAETTLPDGTPGVTVGCGCIHKILQTRLREHGYTLPADPSSGAISNIGGNIGTRASGPHALKYGAIDRFVHSLTIMTADGTLVDTACPDTLPHSLAAALDTFGHAIDADKEMSATIRRKMATKCASGYNLGSFLSRQSPADRFAHLMAGSIGSLGIVTSATLRVLPRVPGRASTLVYFSRLSQAADAVVHLRQLDVTAIEIVNDSSIAILRRKFPDLPVPAIPCHMLLIEYEGEGRRRTIDRVTALLKKKRYHLAAPALTIDGEDEQETLWVIRKALLPTLKNYTPGYFAPALVNDIGVPVTSLATIIEQLEKLFYANGIEACIYGHAGSGNLHIRPFMQRDFKTFLPLVEQLTGDIYGMVLELGGTVTAEHGMGRLRAPWLKAEWGEELYSLMHRIKTELDPHTILNPDILFTDRRVTDDIAPW